MPARCLILLLLLCLGPGTPARAQYLLHPAGRIGMADGLNQSNVTSMALAPDGAVWLSTVKCMYRYDGSRASLQAKIAAHSSEETIGRIVRFNGQLYLRNDYSGNSTPLNERRVGTPHNTQSVSPAGHYLYSDQLLDIPDRAGRLARGLQQRDARYTGAGIRWLGTPGKTCTYFQLADDLYCCDGSQAVLIGGGGQKAAYDFFTFGDTLYSFSGTTLGGWYKDVPLPVSTRLPAALGHDAHLRPGFYHSGQRLYYRNGNSLYLVGNGASGPVFQLLTRELTPLLVTSILYFPDRDVLLVATASDGILIYRKQYLQTAAFEESYEYTVNSIYSIRSSGDSSFVTPMGPLAVNARSRISMPFAEVSQRCLVPVDSQTYLIEQPNGFYYVDKQLRILGKETGPITHPLKCYYWDGSRLYLGMGGRITGWAVANHRLTRPQSFTLGAEEYPGFISGRKGRLIYGSGRGILAIDKITGSIRELSREVSRACYGQADSSGNIWIGTRGQGWYRYNDLGLTSMPNDSRDYLLDAHAIMPDGAGYLWVSTNNGLFRFGHKDAIAYRAGSQCYYNYFDEGFGGRTCEYNGGGTSPVAATPTGRLAFASVNGLVLLDPRAIPPYQHAARPRFLNVSVDGAAQQAGPLSLPPDFRELALDVSDLYFGHPYDQQLSYRLAGDASWTLLTDDRHIRYNRLPPGKYSLTVRSLAGYGAERYRYAALHFVVRPHWYQTLWFLLGAVLLGLLIIVLLFLQKIRRINRQKALIREEVAARTRDLSGAMAHLEATIAHLNDAQDELTQSFLFREQIASSVLHDIRSPLIYLQEAFQHIQEQLPDRDHAVKSQVGLLAGDVKKVADYAQNLLYWMNREEIARQKSDVDISSMLDHLADHYGPLAAASANRIVRNYEPAVTARLPEGLLAIVLRNLLDNAIKYTRNGRITLDAARTNGKVTIVVTDTGIGIEPAQQHETASRGKAFSFGQRFIKDMLLFMNGTSVTDSKPGLGTSVTITLTDEDATDDIPK